MPPLEKKRTSTTEAQKRDIRAHQQQYKLSQVDLLKWVSITMKVDLAQSTILSILSPKYKYLDVEFTEKELEIIVYKKHQSHSAYPQLEALLIE